MESKSVKDDYFIKKNVFDWIGKSVREFTSLKYLFDYLFIIYTGTNINNIS